MWPRPPCSRRSASRRRRGEPSRSSRRAPARIRWLGDHRTSSNGPSRSAAAGGETPSCPTPSIGWLLGLRAGHAIGPALRELAGATSAPLGAELRPLAAALDHGVPVAAALDRWAAHRDASPDVRLVAAALTLGAHAGGEVARAVDQISTTLRERRELQGEVRALATQARTSAAVLAIAPLAFTVLVSTIEPRAVGFLVTTPLGLVCLVLGLGLEALGAIWMNQITRRAA